MKKFAWIFSLALVPAAAFAAERPQWVFPPEQRGPAIPDPPDDGQPKQAPGSTRTYTQSQIDAPMSPPDWFPEEHAPMPQVVAHGNGKTVRACIGCHLANGHGHPENSRVAGSNVAYLMRQLGDFKSGARKGGEAMVTIAKNVSDSDAKEATEFFSGLKVLRWTRVVEADTVPKSYFRRDRRLQLPDGGTEPIGNRIIDVPESTARVMLRDPHSGFVAYVPPGSIAKGRALVTTGGDGKTIACAICHGPTLKGIGEVPAIAGQSPTTIARQLYFMQTGERAGQWSLLMKPVVEKLNADDILAISAYVASLEP